jgi:hypothetical protein
MGGKMLTALIVLAQLAVVTPTPAPSRVILKDGSSLDLAQPYEIRGNQARMKLASGQLVSMPASSVDVDATRRAAAPPTPAPVPAPVAAATPRPKARIVINDLPMVKPSPVTERLPDGTLARPALDASSAPSMEAAWRAKYASLRDSLRAARTELEAAERANPHVYNRSGGLLVVAESQRNATLSPYKTKVDTLEAEMAQMPEDCRKAGCQPGWIRD